jgi:hypothetical protein
MTKSGFTSVLPLSFCIGILHGIVWAGPKRYAERECHNWIEANLTEQTGYRFVMTIKNITQCGAEEFRKVSLLCCHGLKDEQLRKSVPSARLLITATVT